MSDEIRTADEALEAAAREAERTPNGAHPSDYAAAIRALAARIPERDDEALEKLIPAAMIEAAQAAERRLMERARQAQLGHIATDGREWERAVWAAFADFREAIAASRATDDEVEILTTSDPRVTKAARNSWDD